MNPNSFFNNQDNDNNDDRNQYRWPITIFSCPRCSAFFFTSDERNLHYFEEMFTLYGPLKVTKNILKYLTESDPKKTPNIQTTPPASKYYACAIENRLLTRMPPPLDDVEPFDLNQLSKMVPPGATEIDAYFLHDHQIYAVVPDDHETISHDHETISLMPPAPPVLSSLEVAPRVTLDLLSLLNRPISPIPSRGVEPRPDMNIDGQAAGQEEEAPPPGPLALALPAPNAETLATTLALGPPGSKNESTKKRNLDLNLKI